MTTAFLTNWIYVAVFIAAGAAMVVGILLMSPARLPHPPVAREVLHVRVRHRAGRRLLASVRGALLYLRPALPGLRRRGHLPVPVGDHVPPLGGAGFVEVLSSSPCWWSAWSTPGARGRWSGSDRRHDLKALAPRVRYPNLSQFEQPNVVTTTVDLIFSWARSHSVFPFTYGLACCAIEMLSSGFARFDIARYGMEVFRPTPRQCDLMIVAGTSTRRWRRCSSSSTTRWPSPSGSSPWAPAPPAAGRSTTATTSSTGSTRSCRSTCTSRAARRARRRCSTVCSSCRRRSRPCASWPPTCRPPRAEEGRGVERAGPAIGRARTSSYGRARRRLAQALGRPSSPTCASRSPTRSWRAVDRGRAARASRVACTT